MEYLEQTVNRVPKKIAYANEETGITFEEVFHRSKAIGTILKEKGHEHEP